MILAHLIQIRGNVQNIEGKNGETPGAFTRKIPNRRNHPILYLMSIVKCSFALIFM